jgi:hypothetical protein
MKTLSTVLFAGILSFGISAFSQNGPGNGGNGQSYLPSDESKQLGLELKCIDTKPVQQDGLVANAMEQNFQSAASLDFSRMTVGSPKLYLSTPSTSLILGDEQLFTRDLTLLSDNRFVYANISGVFQRLPVTADQIKNRKFIAQGDILSGMQKPIRSIWNSGAQRVEYVHEYGTNEFYYFRQVNTSILVKIVKLNSKHQCSLRGYSTYDLSKYEDISTPIVIKDN